MGKKKSNPRTRAQRTRAKTLSLSSHYLLGVEMGLGEALILFDLCLVLIALALVLNLKYENLDPLKCGGWGVFIAPTTKVAVGRGCCRWAHRTVRCATGHCSGSTVGALTGGATGQSGGAPDSYCSLSGAPSGAALTLRALSVHCAPVSRPLKPTVALGVRCSGGTPDSSVAHRTIW
jgi:hypothetical protein